MASYLTESAAGARIDPKTMKVDQSRTNQTGTNLGLAQGICLVERDCLWFGSRLGIQAILGGARYGHWFLITITRSKRRPGQPGLQEWGVDGWLIGSFSGNMGELSLSLESPR